MLRRSLILFALLLAALWAPLTARATGELPVNSYTLTDLGSLGGGDTAAYGVNDADQVVGLSSGHAFLWQSGWMTDLGTLGGTESIAYAVNNSGQVAGRSTIDTGVTHAFVWDAANGMHDLGTLGGDYSAAMAINDAGQVVGWANRTVGTAPNYDSQTRAFLSQNGRMYDLGTLPGGTYSHATGINASGQVVGFAGDGYTMRAFLWTPTVPNGTTGTMVALPSSTYSEAYGINTSGVAGGHVGAAPYLWDSAGAHALPLLASPEEWWTNTGVYGGGVAAVNDSHHVVGFARHWWDGGEAGGGTFTSAVTWNTANGTRQLGALTDQGVWLADARGINSGGLVAAFGSGRAYLLTPSPLPVRPRDLAARAGDARVDLTWAASYGAALSTTYSVKRAATSGGPYATIASGVTGTTFTDRTVVNGSTYYYAVSAVNAWGESPDSSYMTARPAPPPAAPTGLTATPGECQVSLSWNAAAGADYYYAYRAATSGGPYEWISGPSETTLVDSNDGWGLEAGTTYYYVVTGINPTGESSYSNETAATPTAPLPPSAPTGLAAVPGDRQVALSWNAGSNADHYLVKTSLTSGGPYTVWGAVSGPSATISELTNGQKYYFVVTGVNGGGESPNSNEVSATPTGPPPPAAPTNLTASTKAKKRVDLKWTQSVSSAVTQNRVYRSTTSGGGYTLRATLNAGTSFTDASVTSGVAYYYVVTAVNSGGKESAYSNQASGKPR